MYEIWCNTCVVKEEKELRRNYDAFENTMSLEIETLFGEKKDEKKSRKRKVKETRNEEVQKFKYIGETSRSAFERGVEHYKDLEFTRPNSHMLKHAVIHHPDLDPRMIDFRMKILSIHQTAFERQIREAVMIHKYTGTRLMNSKTEYNRCSIPRIVMKTGNKDSEKDIMIEIEKTADERIKNMYDKKENKRNNEGRTMFRERKKRKLESHTQLSSLISNSQTDSSSSSSSTLFSSHKRSPCEVEDINLHHTVQCRDSKENVLHNSSSVVINQSDKQERLIHPHNNDELNSSITETVPRVEELYSWGRNFHRY